MRAGERRANEDDSDQTGPSIDQDFIFTVSPSLRGSQRQTRRNQPLNGAGIIVEKNSVGSTQSPRKIAGAQVRLRHFQHRHDLPCAGIAAQRVAGAAALEHAAVLAMARIIRH